MATSELICLPMLLLLLLVLVLDLKSESGIKGLIHLKHHIICHLVGTVCATIPSCSNIVGLLIQSELIE